MCCSILSLVEVKRKDFIKGFASLTSCKCKANEIDGERDVDKAFGIVTNRMYSILYEEGKLSFKLSETVSVVYKSDKKLKNWYLRLR